MASQRLTTIASKVLKGKTPTYAEARSLAAKVLANNESSYRYTAQPTGADFLDMFKAAIEPETVTNMRGTTEGIMLTLSDNRVIQASRRKIKAAQSSDELSAYVQSLIA